MSTLRYFRSDSNWNSVSNYDPVNNVLYTYPLETYTW